MKLINRLLNDSTTICFLDFEGTQFTQEIIAIGAIKCELDNKKQIKTWGKPFRVYVKSQGNIGPIVERLTGITPVTLDEQGISFQDAIAQLKKYVGKNYNFISFLTYGSFDMRLLHQTIERQNMKDDILVNKIFEKYVDFSSVIQKFMRSKRNEQLSLVDALKVLNTTPYGTQHDPCDDAINLALLYDKFLKNKNIVKEEYIKVLMKTPHLPQPIKKAISQIYENDDCSKEEFMNFINEEIK